MNQMDIEEMIKDLSVVLNKLAEAKRDAQKHMQGCDDPENLQARVDRLEDTLSDVSCDIDTARDDIYSLMERLEEVSDNMDMAELSSKVWGS